MSQCGNHYNQVEEPNINEGKNKQKDEAILANFVSISGSNSLKVQPQVPRKLYFWASNTWLKFAHLFYWVM